MIQVTESAAAVLPESPAHSARSWCSWRVGLTDSWTSVMGYSYALSHTRIKHTTLLSNKDFTYSFNNTTPQIGMWMYTVEWIPCQKSLFVHKTCWLYNCIIFSGGRSGPPIQSVLFIPSWQWTKYLLLWIDFYCANFGSFNYNGELRWRCLFNKSQALNSLYAPFSFPL